MKNKQTHSLFLAIAFAVCNIPAFSKIVLPECFSDNMVLQQQTGAPIWGKAHPGKQVKITTSWDGKTYTTLSDTNGKWKINVRTPQAGGPYSITISDGKPLVLNNVLIGEVWICSGQSNMEMPLAGWGKVLNYEAEIATANYPAIRLLHVQRATGLHETDELNIENKGWQVCSPATIAEFSSVAYFFGRDLHQNLQIPVGLINTSWGGTIAEAWTSGNSLKEMPDFREAVQQIENQSNEENDKNNPNRPTVLYNAMIYPLIPYSLQGAIWYQGESNVGRAAQYKELFSLMIRDWRQAWNRNFPFYFVQLANFRERKDSPQASSWAELQEAQLQTLHLENTGMAVTIDIGDAEDIHPKNKQEVGRRLALAARANTYHQPVHFSGPLYADYTLEGNQIRIRFKHAGGLQSSDGKALTGFAIAGSDHHFHWATASIEGEEVVVRAPEVKYPVAVRYAWADNPACNLANRAGLPASPFRTDDWK